MAYRLNKTNGDLVVELADGIVDTTSLDISLIGRNYKGYGEVFNENFIRLVENFANSLQPNNPIAGQLWYDTNEQRLKVYNGTVFSPAGAPVVTPNRPELTVGNLWIDNENKQLYFYDGNEEGEYILVGPDFNQFQGRSGWEPVSVIDVTERSQTILLLYIGDVLFAAFTNETFRLSGSQKISGYPDDPNDTVFPQRQLFQKGFNLVDSSIQFSGIADSALALIDSQGNRKLASEFLSNTGNAVLDGTLSIVNPNGLLLGNGSTLFSQLRLDNNTTVLRTVQENADISLQTIVGSSFRDAVYIDGSAAKVGIYRTNPEYELDIEGDARVSQNLIVSGNLTVDGDATYVNVNNLRIEDKNIELAATDGGTVGNDAAVDEAGIIVKSSEGDKTLLYDDGTKTWSSNLDFNLESATDSYKIDDTIVISRTSLGTAITAATGLNEIGQLVSLDVDNINLDGNTISTQNAGLIIDSAGDVSVGANKITNVDDPTQPQDASTKKYTDETVASAPVALSLDTTGLQLPSVANPYDDVKGILESILPAVEKENDAVARIHCVSYANSTLEGIDIASALNETQTAVVSDVDPTEFESVVKDINFTSLSTPYNVVPERQTMIFRVIANTWVWQSTI